jgi:lipocalin
MAVSTARSNSERIDQRLKGWRLVTAAGVVEEEAVEGRAPVLEHTHERAARVSWLDPFRGSYW